MLTRKLMNFNTGITVCDLTRHSTKRKRDNRPRSIRYDMLRPNLLLLLLPAIIAAAQPGNPFAHDAQAAGVGKGVFRIYCAPCHGIRGAGGRGPDLTRGVYNSGDRDADLFHTISAGVAGTEMESYSGTLSEENIWRLVTFIRSLSSGGIATAIKGDPARGRELFRVKGHCANCHMVDGKGGRSGPDLSRVGRQRSDAFLRQSIVDPSAEITPGYATVSVVLRDGKQMVGFERGLDNFTVQMMDLAGKYYSFDKSALGSIKRDTRSLMPDNYGKTFTAPELDDLVAYLSTLHGVTKP